MVRKPDEASSGSTDGLSAAADISTTLADQSPGDLASVNQNTASQGLQVSLDAVPIPTSQSVFSEPAVTWGLTFLAGFVALRYYPKRPGLWRRRALFGMGCSHQCMSDYIASRYNTLVRDAYYSPEDSPERLFWRRLSLIYEVETFQKLLDGFPQIFISKVSEGLEAEWKTCCQVISLYEERARGKLNWKQRLYYSIISPTESRHDWAIAICLLGKRQPDDIPDKDTQELFFFQPAYLSMLMAIPTWKPIDEYAHAGVLVAGAVGLCARHKLVLRFSLLTGMTALAVSCATAALYNVTVVYEPASFKQIKSFNETLGLVFEDPKKSGALPPSLRLEALLESSADR